MIAFALPKGRLQGPLRRVLAELGPSDADLASRKLVLERGTLSFIPLKDPDIATWVERGAADLGVVGADVLWERPADVLEPLDLGFGQCSLVLAGRADLDVDALHARGVLRVATKYPRAAARALTARGLVADIIPLAGSVEVSVLTGLADAIVDLVETGRTLQENGLIVHDTIAITSARVVVNRAAWRLRNAELNGLVETLRTRCKEAGHEAR